MTWNDKTAEILNFRKLNKLKNLKSAVYSRLYSGNPCSKQEMILIFASKVLHRRNLLDVLLCQVCESVSVCVCMRRERELHQVPASQTMLRTVTY